MLKVAESVINEYNIEQIDKVVKRRAKITFTNGMFDFVEYEVSNNTHYDFDDWMFLKNIAIFIEDKSSKLEKRKSDWDDFPEQ